MLGCHNHLSVNFSEEPREVSLSEFKEDDSIPSYRLRTDNYNNKDERPQYNTFSVKEGKHHFFFIRALDAVVNKLFGEKEPDEDPLDLVQYSLHLKPILEPEDSNG